MYSAPKIIDCLYFDLDGPMPPEYCDQEGKERGGGAGKYYFDTSYNHFLLGLLSST